jgi:hypothetical protein
MTAAQTLANNALTKSRAPSFIVPQGPTEKKGLRHGAPLLSLVIVTDYGLGAITVSIFLLDHGRALPWLSLLDHGGMLTITVAVTVLITRLANRYASADRTDSNANFIRQDGRRDSDNHCGSK